MDQCLGINWTVAATLTTAAATFAIAIFTVVLALLQWWQVSHSKKVARANYIATLHSKRMEVFFEIEKFLHSFYRDGRPSLEDAARMRSNLRTAHFLFPEEALSFIDEMFEKTGKHYVAYNDWEPLRARAFAGEPLTEKEGKKMEASLAVMHEIERWFHDQVENKRHFNDLGPFLKLPPSV